VSRYLNEVLTNVSFADDNSGKQLKFDKLLSYGLASELQCLRSASSYVSFFN